MPTMGPQPQRRREHRDQPHLQYARELVPTFDHHAGFPWIDRKCFSVAPPSVIRRSSTNKEDAKSVRPCCIPICTWVGCMVCLSFALAFGIAVVVLLILATRYASVGDVLISVFPPRPDNAKSGGGGAGPSGSSNAPTDSPTLSTRDFDVGAIGTGVGVALLFGATLCFCCCCCCCGRFCWNVRHGSIKLDISAFTGTGYHCCYRVCGARLFACLWECCADGCRQSNEEDAFRMGVHVDLVERSRLNDLVDIQPIPYFVPFAGPTYAYLIIDLPTGEVCAVDPACADLVVAALDSLDASGEYLTSLTLTTIVTTHCHHDHSGGNVRLKARYPGVRVYGGDSKVIPGKTDTVTQGQTLRVGTSTEITCLETTGHTRHHMSYHVQAAASGAAVSGSKLESGEEGAELGVTRWNRATADASVMIDVNDGSTLFEMVPLRGASKIGVTLEKDYTNPYNRCVRVQLKRYVGADAGAVFTGDALFSGSMGALFEGGEKEWLGGMRRIQALPKATLLYCGHEYTLTGYAFAHWLEPQNDVLTAKLEQIRQRRFGLMDKPGSTLPSTLGTEFACVPLFRFSSLLPDIAACSPHAPHAFFHSSVRSFVRSLVCSFSAQLQPFLAMQGALCRGACGVRRAHGGLHCAPRAPEAAQRDIGLLVDPRGSPRLVAPQRARAVPPL